MSRHPGQAPLQHVIDHAESLLESYLIEPPQRFLPALALPLQDDGFREQRIHALSHSGQFNLILLTPLRHIHVQIEEDIEELDNVCTA